MATLTVVSLFAAVGLCALGQDVPTEITKYYDNADCTGSAKMEGMEYFDTCLDFVDRSRTLTCDGTTRKFSWYMGSGCSGNVTHTEEKAEVSCAEMKTETQTAAVTVWSSGTCAMTTGATTTTAASESTVRERKFTDSGCTNLTETNRMPLNLGCQSRNPQPYPTVENDTYVWKTDGSGSSYHVSLNGGTFTIKSYGVADCPASATPTERTITCGSCRAEDGMYKIMDECPNVASFAQKSGAFTFLTMLVAATFLQK